MVWGGFVVDIEKSILLQFTLMIGAVKACNASLEVRLLILRVKLGLQICRLGCATRQVESRNQQREQQRKKLQRSASGVFRIWP